MLLFAILIAWSSVALLVVALCLMAARGDDARCDRFPNGRPEWSTSGEAQAHTHVIATPFDAHPLELLLQDQRQSRRPLTGRVAR